MAAVQAAEPALGLCQSAAVSGGNQHAAAQIGRHESHGRQVPEPPGREFTRVKATRR